MENPLESLLPLRERNTGPMQAKVHIEKGAEMAVFELLDERGVITWLPESEVFRDETGECLNGLFGVVKQGKTTPAGRPVLRVIMNLVPANRLFEVIHGDVQLLPNGTSWIPLVVSEGEELWVSQGDMAAAFYLYSVPATWYPYFAFNYRVQGERIRRTAGQFYRPCCRVLPMGWNSSVGILQQLSREILLTQGLPGELELHKGTPAPVWFTRTIAEASEARAWWQVYLDNFMSAECSEGTYEGLDASLQGKAMSAWHATGVLTADDKQVISAATAVELGIRLDGRLGLLGASPERLFKTALATVHVLQKHGGSVKDAQIILGRWVFILQFRRAAMAVLSHSWETIETPWASKSKVNLMLKELQMLMCLGPVIQTDMRCEYDDMVTCSDASETGGAAARSAGLSWSGHSLTNALQNRGRQPILCPILVVSLFNGVGGAFRIYDILGVRPLGKIAVEINKEASRVTRTAWPDVEEYLDVNLLTKDDVRAWANRYGRAEEVHVWGGFPCVHLSRVRAFRQNLAGQGSNLFWKLLTVLGWIREVFGVTARVKCCIENVASMDEAARREISAELDIQPIKLDPADTLPYGRPGARRSSTPWRT